jgi:hypothetical protein
MFASLALAERNATLSQIVRCHFNLNLITRQNADVMLTHLARNMGNNGVTIFQFNFESGVRQGVYNLAFEFNVLFLRHTLIFMPVKKGAVCPKMPAIAKSFANQPSIFLQ